MKTTEKTKKIKERDTEFMVEGKSYTIEEFSKRTGLGTERIEYLVEYNAIPYFKIGNEIMFDKSIVENWWQCILTGVKAGATVVVCGNQNNEED